MKTVILLISFVVQISVISTFKIIPDYLPSPCHKSVQNYSECTFDVLTKYIPLIFHGVRELNIPNLVPLQIPIVAVNRSFGEYLSISSVVKDIEVWGLDTLQLKEFKLDTDTMRGEVHIFIPRRQVSMQYNVTGRLLTIDLQSAGFLKGNASNTDLKINFTLTQFEKFGINYYTFDEIKSKATIEDVHIEMVSKNPEYQMAADVIANFVNENPQRTVSAIRPIFEEAVGLFFKALIGRVLKTIPASELIPE